MKGLGLGSRGLGLGFRFWVSGFGVRGAGVSSMGTQTAQSPLPIVGYFMFGFLRGYRFRASGICAFRGFRD